jgi:hypothetical protein
MTFKEGIYRVKTADVEDPDTDPTKVASMPVSVLAAMREAAATGMPLKPVTLPASSRPRPDDVEEIIDAEPEAAEGAAGIANEEDRAPRRPFPPPFGPRPMVVPLRVEQRLPLWAVVVMTMLGLAAAGLVMAMVTP